jgi:hypothetical protein
MHPPLEACLASEGLPVQFWRPAVKYEAWGYDNLYPYSCHDMPAAYHCGIDEQTFTVEIGVTRLRRVASMKQAVERATGVRIVIESCRQPKTGKPITEIRLYGTTSAISVAAAQISSLLSR